MHILTTILQFIGAFLLAIVLAATFVGVLFSPIFAGKLIGGRVSRRTIQLICAALSIVFVYGACALFHDFRNHFTTGAWSMLPFFVPLYMGMGMYLGSDQKNRRKQNEETLAKWRAQLATDRAAGAAPVKLSADYREISQLLQRLGRDQEAAAEYAQVIALLEPTLGNHPAMAEYYSQYLRLLSSKTQRAEITSITARCEALPKV